MAKKLKISNDKEEGVKKKLQKAKVKKEILKKKKMAQVLKEKAVGKNNKALPTRTLSEVKQSSHPITNGDGKYHKFQLEGKNSSPKIKPHNSQDSAMKTDQDPEKPLSVGPAPAVSNLKTSGNASKSTNGNTDVLSDGPSGGKQKRRKGELLLIF